MIFYMILCIALCFPIYCTSLNQSMIKQEGDILSQWMTKELNSITDLFDSLPSYICEKMLQKIKSYIEYHDIKEVMRIFLLSKCKLLHPIDMCMHLDQIYYNMLYKIGMEGIFVSQKLCHSNRSLYFSWIVDIPEVKNTTSNLTRSNNEITSHIHKFPKENYKILHLTDIHYDPHYTVGAESNCNYPLCCRVYNNTKIKSNSTASIVGEYSCDTNSLMFHQMLKFAANLSDIKYVIMTGDLLPHDVWLENKHNVIKTINETYLNLKKYFKNISVYPAVGNHESFPSDIFPSKRANKFYNVTWLYEGLSNEWKMWLPSETHETIENGAFYSVMVDDGLKLISINSIFCYIYNFWLYYDNIDPFDQLKWLVNELLDAENKQIKVHIITHIPPGLSECENNWSLNFDRIIDRFSSIVKVIFAGHTHKDHFQIRFDTLTRTIPKNMIYVGPSVTPFTDLNPRMRVYEIDGTTRDVIGMETYFYDITEAKKNNNIQWKLLYNTKEEFSLPDLKPESWKNLVSRMITNDDEWNKYKKIYFGREPNSSQNISDSLFGDRFNHLCSMLTTVSNDTRACNTLDFTYYSIIHSPPL